MQRDTAWDGSDSFSNTSNKISRAQTHTKKSNQCIRGSRIDHWNTYSSISTTRRVKLKPIIELNMATILPENDIYDEIWHTLSFLLMLRPSWSGYMSNAASGSYPGQSKVYLLPIIDLNPNDMSCLFSTLKFIESRAETLGIATPIITFDQLLSIKANEVIKGKSFNMVCMLGGFHLLMSFMGSIRSLMKKSGLEE